MKAYNYFLFRVYWFYRDQFKEGHKMALISTSIVSAVIMFFMIIFIVGGVYFFGDKSVPSLGKIYKIVIISSMSTLWALNYYLLIKPRHFLRENFVKDKQGGYVVLLFLIIILSLLIVIVNRNANKISKEREKARIENNQ